MGSPGRSFELRLDAGLPAVFELSCSNAEFGRGERSSAETIQGRVKIATTNSVDLKSAAS